MTTLIDRISSAFNKASSNYNQFATIQAEAGRTLIQQLTSIRDSYAQILDAGCGTGNTTAALAASTRYESLLAIDISSSLLMQAPQLARAHYKLLNFDLIDNENTSFDLIFSNLALHWSPSFSTTLQHLNHALNENGLLAFTIPLHGSFHEIANTFAINSFMTHETANTLLLDAGFQIYLSQSQLFTATYPDSISALRAIKNTGTNCVINRTRKSLHTKSLLSRLDFNQLSYHIGFFIASH